MKTILVPTDFSQPAEKAVEMAAALAEKLNAHVIILHIVDEPSASDLNVEGEATGSDVSAQDLFTLKLLQKSKAQLAEVIEAVRSKNIAVEQQLQVATPYKSLRDLILGYDVDLIVMGTNGHSKWEKFLIGSNTEKIVRQAHCPVLTVHTNGTSAEFRNIVYATSMLKEEEESSWIIKILQEATGARLHLLWVNTPELFHQDTDIKKAMQRYAENLGLTNYTINVFNDYNEKKGIVHFAESLEADLIALGTHGRTGIAHFLLGSIAESLASDAPLPVLTFPIRQASPEATKSRSLTNCNSK